MSGGDKFFRELIPSAANRPAITIRDAGHFLQEDNGEELATLILEFIRRFLEDRPLQWLAARSGPSGANY